MPPTPKVRPYRWLAEYYDRIFTFHLGWAEAARQAALGNVLPRVESACDLACGTGTTAVKLAKQGIRMYGVDLSPGMVRKAREKARAAGVPLRVIQADMRNFRLPERVDVILCEFDALNHIPRESDLALVAKSAARALKPGGYFFFDVNNRDAFRKVWKGSWWLEIPGLVLVMRGSYDRARDRGVTECEWFIREGALWRRHHEHIEQIAWTPAEMRRMLREAGFDQVRAWDATPFFKDHSGTIPGCRTYYRARRGA